MEKEDQLRVGEEMDRAMCRSTRRTAESGRGTDRAMWRRKIS